MLQPCPCNASNLSASSAQCWRFADFLFTWVTVKHQAYAWKRGMKKTPAHKDSACQPLMSPNNKVNIEVRPEHVTKVTTWNRLWSHKHAKRKRVAPPTSSQHVITLMNSLLFFFRFDSQQKHSVFSDSPAPWQRVIQFEEDKVDRFYTATISIATPYSHSNTQIFPECLGCRVFG